MATWAQSLLQNDASPNVRKFLYGSLVVRDYVASAASGLMTSTYSPFASADGSFSSASPGVVGSGWFDVGFIDTNGAAINRAVAGDDVMGWQSRSALRHDVTSDVLSVQFTMLETRATTLSLAYNLPLGTFTSASAGLGFNRPQANNLYRSFIVYGADSDGPQATYAALILPYASITDFGGNTWDPSNPSQTQLTLTAYPEVTTGLDSRLVYDGPGFRTRPI